MNNQFSRPVTVFHKKRLPREGVPAGYAALIDAFELKAPLPFRICVIGQKHTMITEGEWRYFTPRHAPEPTLEGHLFFAFKYEGLNLLVLFELFNTISPIEIEKIILNTPTGSYTRRLWFLFEWLTGKTLNLKDALEGNYVPVVDPRLQFAVKGERIKRQRVINNLPGTPAFCPLVFRSDTIEEYLSQNLRQKALDVIGRIPADVMSRTAAFLLLKDSRASYAIENEVPPHKRIERWGRIIGEAGKVPLDKEELLRLQEIVLGDRRFVTFGFRRAGGFVGEHDRETGFPIPEHVSARHQDLENLIQGLLSYADRTRGHIDPVVAAAAVAFGFVFIHPFSDGNGRLHRYLIHHILAQGGYNPPGVVFPVSAAILEDLDRYRQILTDYSYGVRPFIDWEPTDDNNVRVLNKTAHYYRYFDATPLAEFLFACVKKTIDQDLPRESEFLIKYDQFRRRVQESLEMPDQTVNLLFRFLNQNDGKLSARARKKEFNLLSPEEVQQIERAFGEELK